MTVKTHKTAELSQHVLIILQHVIKHVMELEVVMNEPEPVNQISLVIIQILVCQVAVLTDQLIQRKSVVNVDEV